MLTMATARHSDTAALNVIQSAEKAEGTALLQKLYDALAADTTDSDDNRQLSIFETYDLLRTHPEFLDGILAPTGNVEAALLKLSPALKVTSLPEGAQIFINDVEVGKYTENHHRESPTRDFYSIRKESRVHHATLQNCGIAVGAWRVRSHRLGT